MSGPRRGTRARSRASPERQLDPWLRLEIRGVGRAADGYHTRRGHRRHPGAPLLEGLSLGLAQLRRARPRGGRSGGRRRRRRARLGAASRPEFCGRSPPGSSEPGSRCRARTSSWRRHATVCGSQRVAGWWRSTTRTAGSAHRGSSSGSTSATASRCASGARSPTNASPRSARSESTPGSATSSYASGT